MKHLTKSVAFLALAALCTPAIQAKTAATDSLVNNYMRSSIYTVLVSSKKQNARYEEEAKNANNAANADMIMGTVKAFANTDAKKAANETESDISRSACNAVPLYRDSGTVQRPQPG